MFKTPFYGALVVAAVVVVVVVVVVARSRKIRDSREAKLFVDACKKIMKIVRHLAKLFINYAVDVVHLWLITEKINDSHLIGV